MSDPGSLKAEPSPEREWLAERPASHFRRVIPASRYSDPAFLAAERERVFGRTWIAAGPERLVRKAGDYFTFEELDESIVVLRDEADELQAFHNSCRHRGTKLFEKCRGSVARDRCRIQCPYHGWVYSLDGQLRTVPHPDGFEKLDRGALGLVPVRVDSWAGFVWINLDADASPLRESLAGLDEELAPYALDEMVPIQEKTWEWDLNWKAVLDNATEYYHVPWVHGQTIDAITEEKPGFDLYGDHCRQTLFIAPYRWRQWLDAHCSRRGPYTLKQRSSLHKYTIFPNFLMNVLPYHLTVFQVWPVGPNRCRFFYGFYKRKGAVGLEWLRAYVTWAASRYILEEDKRVLRRFQDGVRHGRTTEHQLHFYESAIAHHQANLDRWLGDE